MISLPNEGRAFPLLPAEPRPAFLRPADIFLTWNPSLAPLCLLKQAQILFFFNPFLIFQLQLTYNSILISSVHPSDETL